MALLCEFDAKTSCIVIAGRLFEVSSASSETAFFCRSHHVCRACHLELGRLVRAAALLAVHSRTHSSCRRFCVTRVGYAFSYISLDALSVVRCCKHMLELMLF